MALLLAAILLGASPENSALLQLTQQGVGVRPDARVKLPAPTMADGLDAAAQQEVIARVARPNRRVEDLVRKSVVAPFALKLAKVSADEGKPPLRSVDVWFVAYGRLEQFTSEESLKKLAEVADSGRQKRLPSRRGVLTEEEMRKRGLEKEDTPDRKHRYLYSTYPLFDRVQVSTTKRVVVTRSAESILVAAVVDPAFNDDPQYPNQWRPLKRNPAGGFDVGPPHGYEASGFYAKVTKLAEPPGALFVEYHQLFDEPAEWFGGANLLRSKLPLMVQDGVRKLRRRLAKQGE